MDKRTAVAWGTLVVFIVAALQVYLVNTGKCPPKPVGCVDYQSANYGFTILIGLMVGATELISRYRDEPFAPLVSEAGVVYIVINGGAAALAYFLVGKLMPQLGHPQDVLVAGVGAMAFFRSGIFTVRMGSSDVAVGPNLILQVILQALDRVYDRQRASPRAKIVTTSVRSLSFSQIKDALPTLCFNLMQNVSAAEVSAVNAIASGLAASTTMSDEAKNLSLGLALMNVVGRDTLDAAIVALGSSIKGYRQISDKMVSDLAIVDPATVSKDLPKICAELCPPAEGHEAYHSIDLEGVGIGEEGRAFLTVCAVVQHYGEQTVAVALRALSFSQPSHGSPSPPQS
jgi:hypothetical protein